MQGGGSKAGQMELAPGAAQLLQSMRAHSGGSQDRDATPHSSDMIPALKGLSQTGLSQKSDSDVSMPAADSGLGKRTAEEKELQGQKLDLSLALTLNVPTGAKQKRRKKGETADTQGNQKDTATDGIAARTRRKSASDPAQKANLTRPNVWARQEQ